MTLILHVIAGIWNMIIEIESIWIPPLDFVYGGKYPQIYRLYNSAEIDMWHRYFIFLYNSVLFLGGNEMGPRTNLELTTSVCILVFMSIFNAGLFGEMAVEVEKKGRKQAMYQEQIDTAGTAMKQMDLPKYI